MTPSDTPDSSEHGAAPLNTPAAPQKNGRTQSETGNGARPAPNGKTPDAGELPPSLAQRCFNALSYAGPLILLLLLAAQFRLTPPGLTPWLLPQEADFAETYELAKAAGQWLVPSAHTAPLWFWFLRAVETLPYVDGPLAYTVAAFLAGFLALAASSLLALSTGQGRRAAFAGGLVLLSCLYFPPVAHRVGPELLAAGLVVLASACLFRGWSKERSFLWMGIGGLLSGVAGLGGGLFGLLLPLLSSVIFLSAQGKFRRLNRADGAFGFGMLLLPPLVWLGAATLLGGEQLPLKELGTRIIAPLLPPYLPPSDPAWFYALLLPAALFPWILALPFTLQDALKNPRRSDAEAPRRAGTAWLCLNLLIGLILLSAASAKPCLGVLPLVPPAALLLGRALTDLSASGSRAFFLLVSGLFLAAALALGLGSLLQAWPALREFLHLPRPDLFAALKGLPLPALVCLVSSLLLWKIPDRRFPGACLLISALCVTALCQAALLHATPALQEILAAKEKAPAQTAPQTQKTKPAPASPAAPAAPAVPVDPVSPVAPTAPVPPEQSQPVRETTPASPPAPAEDATPAGPEGAPAEGAVPIKPEGAPAEGAVPIKPEDAPASAPNPAAEQKKDATPAQSPHSPEDAHAEQGEAAQNSK